MLRWRFFRGRVGEWLIPADCKSAAPCGLRRFESSPVHQFRGRFEGRADVAQLVERVLGKEEVTSSILVFCSRVSQGRMSDFRFLRIREGTQSQPTSEI